jgi:riboflavin kinase/FMN adenylyltransferase
MRRTDLNASVDLRCPVVTVGTFDGVHLGHAAVLEAVRETARARGGTSVVVTFDPHPRVVVDPSCAPDILTSMEEKAWRIGGLSIDELLVVNFTPSLMVLSPEAFVREYLVRMLRANVIVLGYDHGFGRDRSGDSGTMRKLGQVLGFEVISVPPVLVGGSPVSSTRVRRQIAEGDLQEASRLLGHGYFIHGRIVRGEGRGRQLGYPTANLALRDRSKLLPPDGVYAAWVHLPDPRAAVVNLGVRPTFNGRSHGLEAHVLDYEGDLYGKRVTMELTRRIRNERKFENGNALVEQIKNDRQTAQALLYEADGMPVKEVGA